MQFRVRHQQRYSSASLVSLPTLVRVVDVCVEGVQARVALAEGVARRGAQYNFGFGYHC